MLLNYCEPPSMAEWHECESPWIVESRAESIKKITEAHELAVALAIANSNSPAVNAIPLSASESLGERFQEHADKWEKETAFLSATPMMVLHDSYQSIMAMGPDVVPILLRDLQTTHRHWFWALRHLTNTDPVPEKDKGHVDRMIAAWIDWGKAEGKI